MTFVSVHPPLYESLIALFSFVWPFVALRYVRSRGRSPAPVLAMLVPVLVASCGTWLGLHGILYGMTVLSTGRDPWVIAGIADAFAVLRFGAYSACGVALVALIRRHRPALDRATVSIAVLLAAEVIAAAAVAAHLDPLPRNVYLVRAGAIVAGVVAAAAAVSMFLLSRKRT